MSVERIMVENDTFDKTNVVRWDISAANGGSISTQYSERHARRLRSALRFVAELVLSNSESHRTVGEKMEFFARQLLLATKGKMTWNRLLRILEGCTNLRQYTTLEDKVKSE